MKCPSCGARLGPADPRCSYCGIVTAYGAQLEQQRQQHAAYHQAAAAHHDHAQQQQRLADAKASLAKTARHSLWWSVGGLIACCAFVPSVIGVALGLRARKMASKYNLVLPVQATAGLLLGLFGVTEGIGVIGIAVVQSAQREERLSQLEQALGTRATAKDLEQEVACMLTEKRLLMGGFRDKQTIDDFECDGQVEQKDKQATLFDVRFELSSERFVVKACLSKGERWSTTGFRLDNECSEPDDTAEDYAAPEPTASGTAPNATATATSTGSATTAQPATTTSATSSTRNPASTSTSK